MAIFSEGKVILGPGNPGQHLPDVIAAAIASRSGGARPAGREGDAGQQGVPQTMGTRIHCCLTLNNE